jgi:peroxiredoxin
VTIAVGDHIPDVEISVMGSDAPEPIRTGDVLGRGKVVLFAVPGAFTPTCSDYHLPGFVIRASELRAKGVDTIACLSVNDPFVMDAWGNDQEVGDSVIMLADGNGTFTRAMGLEFDGGLAGTRLSSTTASSQTSSSSRPEVLQSALPNRCWTSCSHGLAAEYGGAGRQRSGSKPV